MELHGTTWNYVWDDARALVKGGICLEIQRVSGNIWRMRGQLTGVLACSLGLISCGSDTQFIDVERVVEVEKIVEVPAYEWETHTLLRQPETYRAVDGVMDTPLNVVEYTRAIDNLTIEGCPTITTRSYNGQVPGPTWRIKPGDTLGPLLSNDLPPESQPMPPAWSMNIPHQLSYTNLHTHGLHVSPGTNADGTQSDDILLVIKPGQSVQYEIRLPPFHPKGTFWYHPHRHGSVMAGVTSGLSGMIVVEDLPGDMPSWIEDAEELEIILQAIDVKSSPDCSDLTIDYDNPPTTSDDLNELFGDVNPQGPFFLVNGQYRPVIKMRPGQVMRWRILDAASDEAFVLSFDRADNSLVALPQLRLIARDGLTLEYPEIPQRSLGGSTSGSVQPFTAYDRRLVIGPGNRLDVMVQAPSEPGVFRFQDLGDDQNPSLGVIHRPILAYLVVEGEPMDMEFPGVPSAESPAEPLPAGWGPGTYMPETFRGMPVARSPEIGYQVCVDGDTDALCANAWTQYDPPDDPPVYPPLNPMFMVSGPNPDESGGLTEGTDAVDKGLLFSTSRIDHCMELNTVEQWTVCNPTVSVHPFHIHTNFFELLQINDVVLEPSDPTDPGKLAIQWKETVSVPGKRLREATDFGPWPCVDWDPDDPVDAAAGPPFTLPGYVIFRTQPVDYTGVMVQHCHILKHEDTGMMQMIEIWDPEDPPTTMPLSDAPSRCTNVIAP